jgi:DNA topoisomerase-1
MRVGTGFEGKGRKQTTQKIEDRSLAHLIRRIITRRGQRLFAILDGSGIERPITAREVNSFIVDATGARVSAKDFRTFRASAAALQSLAENSESDSKRAQTKAITHAAEEASQVLANTRAVARSSYVQPSIIEAYKEGKLGDYLFRGRVRSGLTKVVSALMRFFSFLRARKNCAGAHSCNSKQAVATVWLVPVLRTGI